MADTGRLAYMEKLQSDVNRFKAGAEVEPYFQLSTNLTGNMAHLGAGIVLVTGVKKLGTYPPTLACTDVFKEAVLAYLEDHEAEVFDYIHNHYRAEMMDELGRK